MADLARARALADELVAALSDSPPSSAPITTQGEFEKALSAATPGTMLVLDPTFVSDTPLILKQATRIVSATTMVGRMDGGRPAPTFLGGLTIHGDDCAVIGCELRHPDPNGTIAVITGHNWRVQQCRILGDAVKGARRGIAPHGANGIIRQNYIDECFGAYPGNDTQAVCGWDGTNLLIIDDNYLSGGTETIMFGGGDPVSADRSPIDITISNNTITKNPGWQAKLISVKNTLELKNARHVLIENNTIEYSWGQHGQDGYLLMLTVRNQDGRAPTSTIQDVTIRGNRFAHGAAAINILGRDDKKEDKPNMPTPLGQVRPSVPMQRVTITGNVFDDLDPGRYEGSKKMIQIGGGPIDLTIAENDFHSPGGGLSSVLYFQSGPVAQNLKFTHNRVPKTAYGVFGTNMTATAPAFRFDPGVNAAWRLFTSNGILEGNSEG